MRRFGHPVAAERRVGGARGREAQDRHRLIRSGGHDRAALAVDGYVAAPLERAAAHQVHLGGPVAAAERGVGLPVLGEGGDPDRVRRARALDAACQHRRAAAHRKAPRTSGCVQAEVGDRDPVRPEGRVRVAIGFEPHDRHLRRADHGAGRPEPAAAGPRDDDRAPVDGDVAGPIVHAGEVERLDPVGPERVVEAAVGVQPDHVQVLVAAALGLGEARLGCHHELAVPLQGSGVAGVGDPSTEIDELVSVAREGRVGRAVRQIARDQDVAVEEAGGRRPHRPGPPLGVDQGVVIEVRGTEIGPRRAVFAVARVELTGGADLHRDRLGVQEVDDVARERETAPRRRGHPAQRAAVGARQVPQLVAVAAERRVELARAVRGRGARERHRDRSGRRHSAPPRTAHRTGPSPFPQFADPLGNNTDPTGPRGQPRAT